MAGNPGQSLLMFAKSAVQSISRLQARIIKDGDGKDADSK